MADDVSGNIEILGQKIVLPRTGWGAISLVAIVVAVVAVVYVIAVLAKRQNLDAVRYWWTPSAIDAKGETTPFPNRKMIQFWTPSAKTKESPDVKQWEKADVTEKRLEDFGRNLKKDARVLGYRRYEVFGHGRTAPKWGWWWSMTVSHDYELEDLLKVYEEYWKSGESLYTETTSNGAEYRATRRDK